MALGRYVATLPENVLHGYTIRYREAEQQERRKVASDQGLVQATACAIVDKLNSGEITPLDLLDVLERRIAEVDGQVNALPTLCFDRARTHAKELMKRPVGDRGLLAGRLYRSRTCSTSRACGPRRAHRSSRIMSPRVPILWSNTSKA